MPRGPFWTKREMETLRSHYPYIPAKKMTQALGGRSVSAIMSMANREALRKCHDRLQEMGRENRLGCKESDGSSAA